MLTINKKEDIIIPFEKMSDADWQVKTTLILKEIAENWGDDFEPNPIADEEIESLEQRLNAKLPHSLKLFYQTFGTADIGEELLTPDEVKYLKSWLEDPEYAPDFSEAEQQILPYLVHFGDYLGNGNMFCFHTQSHEIYYFDHDTTPFLSKLFDDFADYLKACLILAQTDFTDGNTNQTEVWTEEIVCKFISADVLHKWRY